MENASGLIQGLAHPALGPDHAAALIGIGLVAVFLGGRARWLLPCGLLIGMAAGAAWGAWRYDLPQFETGIAITLLIIGAVLIAGWQLPPVTAAIVSAVLAFPHGYAHGTEMPLEASKAGYVAGFMIAAALLAAIGVMIGTGIQRLEKASAQLVQKLVGGLIVALGIGFLAGVL